MMRLVSWIYSRFDLDSSTIFELKEFSVCTFLRIKSEQCMFKETVSILSCDPHCGDVNPRFTTVPSLFITNKTNDFDCAVSLLNLEKLQYLQHY